MTRIAGQDIATMMDAIALFDIDTMKGMSFALVPVKTTSNFGDSQ